MSVYTIQEAVSKSVPEYYHQSFHPKQQPERDDLETLQRIKKGSLCSEKHNYACRTGTITLAMNRKV